MILQPTNVELTKVHYFERKNRNISSISREVFQNEFNTNVIIKRNIFGHRWVLKINENPDGVKEKSKLRVVVYVLVFCSIVVAVAFGVFFSLEKTFFNYSTVLNEPPLREHNNTDIFLNSVTNKTTTTFSNATKIILPPSNRTYCAHCSLTEHVCLKLRDTDKPQCLQISDRHDPTGCGGLCKINTQFCQLLDSKNQVYQCSRLKNILECPGNSFSCGNRCIEMSKRCDGILHCSNKSDEENCDCNLETNFQCGNATSCFENLRKCDGQIDCWDKSDEMDCKKLCQNEEFKCSSGECIPKEKFCDGAKNCEDNSDEPQGCANT